MAETLGSSQDPSLIKAELQPLGSPQSSSLATSNTLIAPKTDLFTPCLGPGIQKTGLLCLVPVFCPESCTSLGQTPMQSRSLSFKDLWRGYLWLSSHTCDAPLHPLLGLCERHGHFL